MGCARGLAAAATLALAGLAPRPASAAPEPEITAVFRAAECELTVCDPGTDRALEEGAAVRGTIQVHVRARSPLGLNWVRLEAKAVDDPKWWCIQQWDAARAPEHSAHYDWTTERWAPVSPDWGCAEQSDHQHTATTNGPHLLRAKASELTGEEADSEPFALTFDNPPARVRWAGDPDFGFEGDRPAVAVRFYPGDQPDLVEYRVSRRGPDGSALALVVDPRSPESTGCTGADIGVLTCVDRTLPARFGGDYRYTIRAFRPGLDGSPCRLAPEVDCIASPVSEGRDLRLPARAERKRLDTSAPTAPPKPSGGTTTHAAPPPAAGDPGRSAGAPGTVAARSPGRLPQIAAAVVLVVGIGAALARRRSARPAQDPDSFPSGSPHSGGG